MAAPEVTIIGADRLVRIRRGMANLDKDTRKEVMAALRRAAEPLKGLLQEEAARLPASGGLAGQVQSAIKVKITARFSVNPTVSLKVSAESASAGTFRRARRRDRGRQRARRRTWERNQAGSGG